jgi:regulator of ribonuclease activity A
MTVPFKTADLCDRYADELQVCEPAFTSYGGESRFYGEVSTVKCFEDNSRVREALAEPGHGRVLVVDAGGSPRCAMLGDQLAASAVDNGWSGVVLFGMIRDSSEIAQMPLGVMALGTHPLKSVKRGVGERDIAVRFAGVTFAPGDLVYVDEDGIVCSARRLPPP